MKRRFFDLRRLSAQLILSFMALVLLTAAAAGLPALWLIGNQLRQQAWNQVEQGNLAAQALYEAKEKELMSLATLTAERPTLRELVTAGSQAELSKYLATLQQGSGLDQILICNANQEPISLAGKTNNMDLCPPATGVRFIVALGGTEPQAWLMADHTLNSNQGNPLGSVWVGFHLDDAFAAEMRAQTGLEHTLLVGGTVVATSLEGRPGLVSGPAVEGPPSRLSLNGYDYYVKYFPLGSAGLEAEVALEVTDLSATARNLAWALAGSILLVTLVASLLGTYLARRISAPLARLAEAASTPGGDDTSDELDQVLARSLSVETSVREVALVAQALESARRDLKHSIAELRQEKDWTDHLLASIVEGIITLDRQGHITFFSHGAERITGWHREEVLGRTCDQIFQPSESDRPFSQLIPTPDRKNKIPVELRDGRQAILAVTGARLMPPARGDARVALVFRDVSEEEAVHRLLGHFLANVAHEFRTPLSALAASVELLLDQASELSPEELEELLTSLHLGVLGLQTLIDNLLESASIETGHFRVSPRRCNLGDIVAEAIGMLQPLLDKHGQSLVVGLPATIPTVYADPRRTVQVLINLLSNANKYGPDHAEIEIAATLEGSWVRISVADAGPGVPAEYRPDLFRQFAHPLPSSDKAQVGVGLGLSVVKAVVEAHGGQVGVDERKEGGSIFWFTLPHKEER